jgi:hypothetical protein
MQDKFKNGAVTPSAPPVSTADGEPKLMKKIQLRVGIRVAPDGEPCVFFEWADGTGFMCSRGQALCFAFNILGVARNLFRNVAELDEAVVKAKSQADAWTRAMNEAPPVQ